MLPIRHSACLARNALGMTIVPAVTIRLLKSKQVSKISITCWSLPSTLTPLRKRMTMTRIARAIRISKEPALWYRVSNSQMRTANLFHYRRKGRFKLELSSKRLMSFRINRTIVKTRYQKNHLRNIIISVAILTLWKFNKFKCNNS